MDTKRKRLIRTLSVAVIALAVYSCSTVAVTGRKQLSLVSNEEVLSLSKQNFNEFMTTAKASANATQTAMVKRVGTRIASAVERYLESNGRSADIQDFAWEFHLVQSSEPNAFCMPGGKIVVYEGILPYTQTEEGLAIVLGHEVAHAVARHSSERLSQQMLLSYGGVALDVVMQKKSSTAQALAQQVYGLGAQVGVMLPYSRLNENEADHMGLIFAAMAGYNPQAAVSFWQRMAQNSGGGTPEFLSTHPSDASRIKRLTELMPEAMKYYNPNGTGTSADKTIHFDF